MRENHLLNIAKNKLKYSINDLKNEIQNPKSKIQTPDGAFEKMDKMYRHQRYFYDFTRKYYLLGRDKLIAKLDVQWGENILEVGCGTGANLEMLANFGTAEGVDVSDDALEFCKAKGLEAHKGLAESLPRYRRRCP